ncbi:cysteine-rich CWC family protein [Lysinibacillus sp. NPDC097195]|uniref:cysteine-rich CWC family protein n=1 Tax=Lysinibacillus sp. NPDC097195 TaxID=3364141 RepID=UPI00380B6212
MQNEEKCCPLCGKENNCGVAEGQQTCWCMTDNFPEGILEIVSNERNKCICQNCLHTYKNR